MWKAIGTFAIGLIMAILGGIAKGTFRSAPRKSTEAENDPTITQRGEDALANYDKSGR